MIHRKLWREQRLKEKENSTPSPIVLKFTWMQLISSSDLLKSLEVTKEIEEMIEMNVYSIIVIVIKMVLN